MSVNYYEQACAYLCKHNVKFWDNDNIPAQLIAAYKEIKQEKEQENDTKLIAQRSQDDQERGDRAIQEAINSYDSEEDRLKCSEEFKEMNRKTFKKIDRDLGLDIDR